jgi:hypothetical protein
VKSQPYPRLVLVKDGIIVFNEWNTEHILILVRCVICVCKHPKYACIRMPEFCSFKEIPLGFNTEILIGIELKLEWTNELSNITARHFNVTIGAIIAINSGNLVLP